MLDSLNSNRFQEKGERIIKTFARDRERESEFAFSFFYLAT